MKSLVIFLFKHYVVSAINDVLAKNKNDVSKICETIHLWTTRLSIICEELKKINSRCADGKIEDEEIKESIKEVEKIIKEF